MAQVEAGERAVLLFVVNHSGIEVVKPADRIDPVYGTLLRQAQAAGVEVLAYRAGITSKLSTRGEPDGDLSLVGPVPVRLQD
jgi:sugar fermentation stimulation protein A